MTLDLFQVILIATACIDIGIVIGAMVTEYEYYKRYCDYHGEDMWDEYE